MTIQNNLNLLTYCAYKWKIQLPQMSKWIQGINKIFKLISQGITKLISAINDNEERIRFHFCNLKPEEQWNGAEDIKNTILKYRHLKEYK